MVKGLAMKNCRKFGGKNFGELQSIYIWSAMEIVKKTCQSFFTANLFYCTAANCLKMITKIVTSTLYC